MIEIEFTGWQTGLKKVSLNRLLRDKVGMSAKEAHELVDRLLDGERVSIRVASREVAEEITRDTKALGVIVGRGENRPITD